jgi:DNA-directed RNA polymerase subunit RPC12/RpoP
MKLQELRGSFRSLEAAELYCSRCGRAQPVRKRLLLVLPEGDKYEYLCARCGEGLGTKLDKDAGPRR